MKITITNILVFVFAWVNLFSQTNNNATVDLEKIERLKKGIYLNFEEFKYNSPSIEGEFEVVNENPNYIVHPEENNKYFISYYDNLGEKREANLEKIWGFNDGFGIYIINKKKPYKMVFFGSIAILQYENHYKKNVVGQIASLILMGSTVTEGHKIKLLFFSPLTGTVSKYTETNFKQFLNSDPLILNNYINDESALFSKKHIKYLNEYNTKYPLFISSEGIVAE